METKTKIMIKIQIKSIYGSVLFEYEKENNTIRETLLKAIEGDADLSYANLSGANLSDIRINESTFGAIINCPEEGSFIGFKKCDGKIVKLLILEDAKRSSATTYKCRASKVKTIEIEGGLTRIVSDYDNSFEYVVGEIQEVSDFDDNRWNECSTGIHFFMSREMARQYN